MKQSIIEARNLKQDHKILALLFTAVEIQELNNPKLDKPCLFLPSKDNIYTNVYYRKKVEDLHRAIYMLFTKQKLLKGEYVLHRCKNKGCIEITHLYKKIDQNPVDIEEIAEELNQEEIEIIENGLKEWKGSLVEKEKTEEEEIEELERNMQRFIDKKEGRTKIKKRDDRIKAIRIKEALHIRACSREQRELEALDKEMLEFSKTLSLKP